MEPVIQPPEETAETQTESPQTSVLKPAFENKPVTGGGKRWGIFVALGLLIVTVTGAGYLGLSMEKPQKKTPSPPVSAVPTSKPTAAPVKPVEVTPVISPTPQPTNIITAKPTGSGTPGKSYSVRSITLTGQKGDGVMLLGWQVKGYSPQGFEVMWSVNPNPTYPPREGDNYYYLGSAVANQYQVSPLAAGNIYYFRVCSFEREACGVYSNELVIQY